MLILKSYKLYILVLVIALTSFYVINSHDDISKTVTIATAVYKCPADYTDDKAYKLDLDAFVVKFAENNPSATEEEMLAERDRLFIEAGCINRYYEDKETYLDWCPLSEQEINATLEYMRNFEPEEVLDLLHLLADRKCNSALTKLNLLMTQDIESGTSPGTQ